MQPTPRVIYEFGPFRLDFQRHAFTKSGQPVSLPPKAFDILVMLLDRRDTLVPNAPRHGRGGVRRRIGT